MHIGILTYHRSQNYGAQLQAYALQTYLAGLGHDVELVDYWPEYHRALYRPHHFDKSIYDTKSICGKISYLLRAALLYLHSWLRGYRTRRFVRKYMRVTSSSGFDVLVYGSDQIWRKQHMDECPSYNLVYFGGGGYSANYRIAYAASMGKNEAEGEDMVYLRQMLSRFAAISVRESDLQDFVQNRLQLPATLVADPVFLLTSAQWQNILPKRRAKKSPYILVYNIARCEKLQQIANQLSHDKNIPIVQFHGYVDKVRTSCNDVDTAGADAFLHYLRDADYVVTSSFHGVALSLCFEKQFYFATIDELSNRTESLLSQMQLSYRNLSKISHYDFSEIINYSIVSSCIEAYALQSRQWLMENVQRYSDSL